MNGTRSGRLQRQKLLGLAHGDPGLSVLRLAHLAGMSWTACEYHLRRLEAAGRVVLRRVNGQWRVFDASSFDAQQMGNAGLLRIGRNARIAEAVLAQPGAAQADLVAATGIPPSSLCRRLQQLDAEGLIERRREGRSLVVYPTAALETVQASLRGPDLDMMEVLA